MKDHLLKGNGLFEGHTRFCIILHRLIQRCYTIQSCCLTSSISYLPHYWQCFFIQLERLFLLPCISIKTSHIAQRRCLTSSVSYLLSDSYCLLIQLSCLLWSPYSF